MIRILIHSADVREQKGVSKTTQKPYHLRIQTAYIWPVDSQGNEPPFPEKFELLLDNDQAPWPKGEYQLHPSSVYMSREGKLSLSPRLAPAPKAPARAAA